MHAGHQSHAPRIGSIGRARRQGTRVANETISRSLSATTASAGDSRYQHSQMARGADRQRGCDFHLDTHPGLDILKTHLELGEHSLLPGQKTIELWHDGELIGQVYGGDGPGLRVLSKHRVQWEVESQRDCTIIEIKIEIPSRN